MLIQNSSLSCIPGFNRHGMKLLSVFDVHGMCPLKCYSLNHCVQSTTINQAMMNNLKISTRLIILISILSLLLIAIGAMGLLGISRSNDEIKSLHDKSMIPALMADDSIDKLVQNRLQVLLAFQHAPDSPLASIHNHPTSMHTGIIAANQVEADRIFKTLQEFSEHPKERSLLEACQNTRALWRIQFDKATQAVGAGNFSSATMAQFLKAGREEGETAVNAMHAYRDYQLEQANAAYTDAQGRYQMMTIWFSVSILMGLLVTSLLGLITIRTISRQLGGEPEEAVAVAKRVGAGDLCVQINLQPGDSTSLMAHMKAMQASLRQVVSNVRQSSEYVATASAQIASGNNDLSARTETQASALQETSATMEELSATVKQNADHAQHANQLAQSACTSAILGGEVVARVVETMKNINVSSNRIFDIIGVIDGIAFQTNILALNAAVEAARAGEQGRGFAVVASEVRSLAGRAANAAKEIKNLIGASVERVAQGSSLINEAVTTMTEVVDSIRSVTDIMEKISGASHEQNLGVSQVGEAVAQIDQTTQQNAALVEEMAAAACSLKSQAKDLLNAMTVFKLPHE